MQDDALKHRHHHHHLHHPPIPTNPYRPPSNHHANRYDTIHYNVAAEDYPLKFVSLYTHDNEEERADTLPPTTSSIGASSELDGNGNEGGVFAKNTHRSLTEIFVDFCDRTSSHGIPHIASSPSLVGKIIWTIVFVACSVVFAYQTYLTVHDYMRWRTVIEIELKFEAAAFPAVTVCNLNPYKASLLFNISEVENVYQQYIQTIRPSIATLSASTAPSSILSSNRTKRQVRYHPMYVHCRCANPLQDCVPLYNLIEPDRTTCLCFEDSHSGDIWPCYQVDMWTEEKRCTNCSLTNSCDLPTTISDTGGGGGPPPPPRLVVVPTESSAPSTEDEEDESSLGSGGVPCICQTISNKCIKLPPGGIPWWKPLNYNIYNVTQSTTTSTTQAPTTTVDMTGSPFDPEKDNAGTAIVRLNTYIRGILSAMDNETRFRLSYNASELVVWCSFNAEVCYAHKDFRLHFDPVYGNCYTFNYNITSPLKNTRAGPTHGLRLLLNVNQSDYLPFTEAAGVRIVIHEQDHYPFPDSLGYSAPTGMISSFGLKCQKMTRIRACQETYLEGYYVFDENYSTEGCIRSCFQRLAVEQCGCGDPRFPVAAGQRTCYPISNETTCLIKFTEKFGKFPTNCTCEQPCRDTVFQSSFSAATWPADNFVISSVCPEDLDGKDCVDYVRTNTALIEIFFEQLSFEDLSEVEAYGIINLLADFGGNIGLWIGFSVITFVEFLELAVELLTLCCQRTRAKVTRKKRARYSRPVAFQYVNRGIAEESFQDGPGSSMDESSDRSSMAAQTHKT